MQIPEHTHCCVCHPIIRSKCRHHSLKIRSKLRWNLEHLEAVASVSADPLMALLLKVFKRESCALQYTLLWLKPDGHEAVDYITWMRKMTNWGSQASLICCKSSVHPFPQSDSNWIVNCQDPCSNSPAVDDFHRIGTLLSYTSARCDNIDQDINAYSFKLTMTLVSITFVR